ncbi:BglG family transcription antiterminator [Pectinatus frisingensis]|uniref:BglG family transcription antiterminator n=1 Tax=Pectinatus frisingensis TaxID=865 RepID=UPI0018C7800E|nr:PTS sugar transporter subunit IIA [Pectinatus frisingensis]
MALKALDIYLYLSRQKDFTTSKKIAVDFGVSTRTIKSYIKKINIKYGKKIIISTNRGYRINPQMPTEDIIKEQNNDNIKTSDERRDYIVKKILMMHDKSVDIFDLCEELDISYSTINNDIANLNKIFAPYRVNIIVKNEQILLSGKEKDIRKWVSSWIYNNDKNSFMDIYRFKEYFTKVDLEKLSSLVRAFFVSHNIYINDFGFNFVLLHLAIIIYRKKNNNIINVENNISPGTKMENSFSRTLCVKLENEFDISLDTADKYDIYLLIKSNTIISYPKSIKGLVEAIGKDFINKINSYIKSAEKMYFVDLSNKAFVIPFALHVRNMIFRLKDNKILANPMTSDIKIKSPIIYDIAIYMALCIGKDFKVNITEDETAFLAIHIAGEIERQNKTQDKIDAVIFCPNYLNITSYLQNKLMINFGNQLNFVDVADTMDDLKSLRYDILFTGIKLPKGYCDKIVVEILPYSIENNLGVIQDAINKVWRNRKNELLKKYFDQYFEKELFFSDIDLFSRKEIIHFLCENLQKLKYVEKNFENDIIQREAAANTAFAGIAIPHSIKMDAIKTCVSVVVSKKGIKWGDEIEPVHVVFLLAINKMNISIFRKLYESLISIFSAPVMTEEIKKCDSFNDFKGLLV